jgi:riboflavin synthase
MFTGIIRHTGICKALERISGGARLIIAAVDPPMELVRGESVAVNGVCLTVFPHGDGFYADLSPETLSRTSFESLPIGTAVNLEQAMRLGDRLGGHLVQGHVDATGMLLAMQHQGDFAVFRWSYPREYWPLVIDKGSISVDGISLTIVEPDEESFAVALIPETLEKTNLRDAALGSAVNLEFDIMAKFAQKLIEPYRRG